MAQQLALSIKINADGTASVAEINRVREALGQMQQASSQAGSGLGDVTGSGGGAALAQLRTEITRLVSSLGQISQVAAQAAQGLQNAGGNAADFSQLNLQVTQLTAALAQMQQAAGSAGQGLSGATGGSATAEISQLRGEIVQLVGALGQITQAASQAAQGLQGATGGNAANFNQLNIQVTQLTAALAQMQQAASNAGQGLNGAAGSGVTADITQLRAAITQLGTSLGQIAQAAAQAAQSLNNVGGGNSAEIAQLRADVARLSGELDALRQAGNSAGQGLNNVETASRTLKGTMASLAPLIAGLGLGVLASDAMKTARHIDTMSAALGVGAEQYQRLGNAFGAVGVELEDTADIISTFGDYVEDAFAGSEGVIEDLGLVGLAIEDLEGLSPDEMFLRFADALSETENANARTTAAVRLLGDAGLRLMPILDQGGDAIVKLGDEMGVFDEGARRAASAIQGDLTKAVKSAQVAVQSLVLEGLELLYDTGAIDALMDGFNAVTGVINHAAEAISNSGLRDELAGWGEAFGDVAHGAGEVLGFLQELPNPMRQLYDLIPGIEGQATAWEQVTHNLGFVADALLNLPDNLRQLTYIAAAEIAAIEGYFSAGWGVVVSVTQATWATITAAVGSALNSIQGAVASAVAWIAERLAALTGSMSEFAAKVAELPIPGNFAAGLASGLDALEAKFASAAAGAAASKTQIAANTESLKADETAAWSRVSAANAEVAAAGERAQAGRDLALQMGAELEAKRESAKAERALTREHEDQVASYSEMADELAADQASAAAAAERSAAALDKAGKAAGRAGKAAGGAGKAAKGAAKGVKTLADAADEARKALEAQARGVDRLIKEFLPLRAAQDELRESVETAAAAYQLGKLSAEEYAIVIQGLHAKSTEAVQAAEGDADGFAGAWQDGIDGLSGEFESLFKGMMTGGVDAAESLKDYLLDWVAKMAAGFAANPLKLMMGAVGIGGASGAAATGLGDAAQQAVGGDAGGSVGMLGNMGKMLGGNSMGTQLANTLTTVTGKLGMSAQWIGDAASNLAQTSNLAMGAGGLIGGIGSKMLFGFESQAETIGNTIGSTAGTAIGAAVLTPILGPLAPLFGSFLGGTAGGFLGGLFGGEKKPKMQANLWRTEGEIEIGDTNDMSQEAIEALQGAVDQANQATVAYGTALGEGAQEAMKNATHAFGKVAEGDLPGRIAWLFGDSLLAGVRGSADQFAAQGEQAFADAYRDSAAVISDLINNSGGRISEDVAKQVQDIVHGTIAEKTIIALEQAGHQIGDQFRGTMAMLMAEVNDPAMVEAASQQFAAMIGQFGASIQDLTDYDTSSLEGAARGFQEFWAHFEGSAGSTGESLQYMIAAIDHLQAAAGLTATDLSGLNVAQFSDIAKELAPLTEQTTAYYQLFYSEQERTLKAVEAAQGGLTAAFDELAMTMPESKEGFRALVEGLDLATEEGRDLYGSLMELAPTFAFVADNAVEVVERVSMMSEALTAFVDGSGELAGGIRGLLNDVIYQGLDASPAFAEMIEQYIVGTLLDSISQAIFAAVVQPLVESAAASATSVATGGAIAGTAVEAGGTIAAEELAAIVDEAISMTEIMGQVLKDEGFKAAMSEIGEAINQIGGEFTAPAGYQHAQTTRDTAIASRAESEAAEAKRIADEAAAETKRIADERAGIEREYLQLQGDLVALRALDLDAVDASNRELKLRNLALQDEQALLAAFGTDDSLSDALTASTALFDELGATLPTSQDAMAAFIRESDLTADELLMLVGGLDDLKATIGGIDLVKTAFKVDSDPIEETRALFERLGLAMPASSSAMADLVHSGELTADEMVQLAGSLDDVKAAYSSFDALIGAFQPDADPLAATQALFDQMGRTLPISTGALAELIHSGELTADEMILLAGNLNVVTAGMQRLDAATETLAATADSLDGGAGWTEAMESASALFESIGLELPATSEGLAEFLRTANLTDTQLVTLADHGETLTTAFQGLDAAIEANVQNADALRQRFDEAATAAATPQQQADSLSVKLADYIDLDGFSAGMGLTEFQAAFDSLDASVGPETVARWIEAGNVLIDFDAAMQLVEQSVAQMSASFALLGHDVDGISQLEGVSGEDFAAQAQAYFESFIPEQERMGRSMKEIEGVFADLNLAVPTTKAEFRSVIESLDPMTEAGQQAIVALMGVAGSFALIADAADAIDMQRREMEIELMRLQGREQEAVNAERAIALQQLPQELRALQQRIWAAQDAIAIEEQAEQRAMDALDRLKRAEEELMAARERSIKAAADAEVNAVNERVNERIAANDAQIAFLNTALSNTSKLQSQWEGIGDSLKGWVENARAKLNSTTVSGAAESFQTTLAMARAGDADSASRLGGSADAYIDQIRGNASTREDYLRQSNSVINDVGGVQSAAEMRARAYLAQMNKIEGQIEALERQNEELKEEAQRQIEEIQRRSQEEIEALRGTSELTLEQAKAQYDQAQIAAEEALRFYEESLFGQRQMSERIVNAINGLELSVTINVPSDSGGIGEQSFSGGGIASGPKSGYGATLHGTEAVIPLDKGSVPLDIDFGALIGEFQLVRQEIETLRLEQRRQHQESAREQSEVAEILKQWEAIGQPATRG